MFLLLTLQFCNDFELISQEVAIAIRRRTTITDNYSRFLYVHAEFTALEKQLYSLYSAG